MPYLITQMLLCLLLAALLGFLIGWFLRSALCRRRIEELEAAWAQRRSDLEQRLAATPVAAAVDPDDLTRIEGIGPKIQKLLNDDLIYTWAQLADTPVDRLRRILRNAGERFQMHDPTSWPDQAKLAADGRWKELDEFQELLEGGRES